MPNSNKNKQVGYSEKMTMPPLGLISIGGYLKMHGYMVEILDLFTNHIRKQEFIDKIKNAHPDMIGISAYTENINAVIHLTKIIKSVLPKIIIVLGGAHVTFLPEEALQQFLDDMIEKGFFVKDGDYSRIETEETICHQTSKVTWQQIIFTFLYGILLYSIYTVFQLPGYYKYGSINGRMFMYIPIIGFLLVLFGMEKVNLSKNGFAISIFSNLGILAAVITFGIILIYTVSICISIRIMKNKEI